MQTQDMTIIRFPGNNAGELHAYLIGQGWAPAETFPDGWILAKDGIHVLIDNSDPDDPYFAVTVNPLLDGFIAHCHRIGSIGALYWEKTGSTHLIWYSISEAAVIGNGMIAIVPESDVE